MREPSQVFILLESVFKAFDELAQQYGIFKVETVGDCYVAACGTCGLSWIVLPLQSINTADSNSYMRCLSLTLANTQL